MGEAAAHSRVAQCAAQRRHDHGLVLHQAAVTCRACHGGWNAPKKPLAQETPRGGSARASHAWPARRPYITQKPVRVLAAQKTETSAQTQPRCAPSAESARPDAGLRQLGGAARSANSARRLRVRPVASVSVDDLPSCLLCPSGTL